MAKKASKIRTDPGELPEKPEAEEKLDRAEQLAEREDIREALLDIFNDVEKGFDKQAERSDSNMDYWDVYNCELGQNQFYNGNSKIFVPIVYDAVNARKTRFVNQLFPSNGRYVEVTTEDGTLPQTEMALLEHYIRQGKLRTRVAPALAKNADIEGQMTVQCSWEEHRRHVVYKVRKPPEGEDGAPPDEEDIEDIQEEEIVSGAPHVEVVADSDLLVLPSTANSLQEALDSGGCVTTLKRWSKAKLKKMIKSGDMDTKAANEMLEEMSSKDDSQKTDKAKEMVDAAGIKGDGRGKYALIYRTWVILTIKGERRLCLAYYGGKDRVLSCKRNPYWSDRVDIISAPSDKVDGSFKGVSRVKFVAALQYQANDACNEGMDSAAYALMPIVMTDPEKNPKTGSMVLALAAVWETSPTDTQFAKFPALWKDALEIIAACKSEIFQALSVNPAQITQAGNPKSKKPSQAEIANEQQIDILTTTDFVTVMEDEILSPIVSFMMELDHQYRDKELTVREYGETGMLANMLAIPPLSMNKLYQFRWYGVEQARNAQMLQQQIGFINVLKGVPPQMYQGYKVDLGPILSQAAENLFGPRLAPLTFKDMRRELSFEPQQEDKVLAEGFATPVHPQDDHMKHVQDHMQAAKAMGDPHGVFRVHIMAHMQALQAQQAASAPTGGPPQGGAPGGGGPRSGAAPGAQRPAQQPPGAIHADRMKDPAAAPRPQ